MTPFERTLLGLIAASALLIAFVVGTTRTAAALVPNGATTVTNTIAGDTNGGIPRGLVTTGTGHVKARPDMVEVSLGVTALAETAAGAQSIVADREARVLARALTLGIPTSDVKTASYRIDPQYSYQPGAPARLTGYQAQETVIVIVRDVDGIGKALDTFVQDDGAMTTAIRFALSDPSAAQAAARERAIADARAKAEAMAKVAGIKLGRIVALADALLSPQANVDRTTFSQLVKSPSQIPVSDLDVNVSVQVQFETE